MQIRGTFIGMEAVGDVWSLQNTLSEANLLLSLGIQELKSFKL